MQLKLSLKYRFVLTAFMAVTGFNLSAQTGLEFYPMEKLYNSYQYNPAFLTSKGQYTLSIFPFSGTSVAFNNPQEVQNMLDIQLSDLKQEDKNIELAKIIVDRSNYTQQLQSELLSFTYRTRDGFLNFRISENEIFSASLQGPVSSFLLDTQAKSVMVGSFQRLPAFELHYRKYSMGYSWSSHNRDLTFGFRGNLYFGKSVFSSGISSSVNELAGTYYIKMNGMAKMSMPEQGYLNADGSYTTVPGLSGMSAQKYMLNAGNSGFGFDLGTKYQITPRFSASLSILDFGAINWKNNLNSKSYIGGYTLRANSIDPTSQDGGTLLTKTSDTISYDDGFSKILQVTTNKSLFSTRLPTTFYGGISYQLNRKITLHLTERYLLLKRLNQNSFSLTANIDLSKKLSLNTGYAAIGNAYNTIPVALLFSPDFGQLYLGTGNLLTVFTPESSEFSGLSFGMCFYLLHKRKLYGQPTDDFPYHRPKKVKKVERSGHILQEFSK